MAWPYVAAAGIAATSALHGGHLARGESRRARSEEYERQKEFAQMGIRWRVADAKAAGLHPLFALGAATPGYSPSVQVGDSGHAQAGQEISRAMLASAEHGVKREQAGLAAKLADAAMERDYAQAAYYWSLALRTERSPGAGAPTDPSVYANPNVQVNPNFDARTAADLVKVNPSEAVSYSGGDRSLAAARSSVWQEYVYRDDKGKHRVIYLPGGKGSIEEALESVSENYMLMLTVLNENIRRNPEFLSEARGTIPFAGLMYDSSDFLWQLRNQWQKWRHKQRRQSPAPQRLK